MKKGYQVALLVLVVLLIDQATKFYIKTTFEYNGEVLIFGQEWARLHFVENEGMAFGMTLDWEYGKLTLSLFRILMVAGLIFWIKTLIEEKMPTGFIMSVGLITAGALGNIIDSAIYGMIFSASPYHGGLAEVVPWGTGYASLLHGKVVDMFYFPMHTWELPDGDTFTFFSPIFNVADAAITTGVLSILIFQRIFFRDSTESKPAETPAVAEVSTTDDTPATEGDNAENQELDQADTGKS
ncbi:MAG: lipoprotein signal peptidase [Bacteroidota bacterium]